MQNQKLLIIVDIILFVAFLLSLITGLVMWIGLPAGSGKTGAEVLGMTKHSWKDIHLYSSLVFAAIVIGHILMHFNWIKAIPRLWKGTKQN